MTLQQILVTHALHRLWVEDNDAASGCDSPIYYVMVLPPIPSGENGVMPNGSIGSQDRDSLPTRLQARRLLDVPQGSFQGETTLSACVAEHPLDVIR